MNPLIIALSSYAMGIALCIWAVRLNKYPDAMKPRFMRGRWGLLIQLIALLFGLVLMLNGTIKLFS